MLRAQSAQAAMRGLGTTKFRNCAAELIALASDVSPMLLARADGVIKLGWMTTAPGAHEKRCDVRQ